MLFELLLAGCALVICFLISLLAVQAGVSWTARPLFISSEAPWYERARMGYPARLVAVFGTLAVMPPITLAAATIGDQFHIKHLSMVSSASMLGSGLAIILVYRRFMRRFISRPVSFAYWLCGVIVVSLLFLSHLVVPLLVLIANGGAFDWRTVGLVVGGIVIVTGLWFWSLRILCILGLARPAGQRLVQIVQNSARKAGIPVPTSYELRWPMVNALAFPMVNAVAFSDAALQLMDDEQLAAICTHELAHLTEPPSVRALRIFGSLLVFLFVMGIMFAEKFGALSVLICGALFFIGRQFVSKKSRQWESRADAAAGSQQGSELAYARALLDLHRANMIPLVGLSQGGTHPHGYDRLVAAGLQPDFPRPSPPPKSRLFIGVAIMTLMVVVPFLLAQVAFLVYSINTSS